MASWTLVVVGGVYTTNVWRNVDMRCCKVLVVLLEVDVVGFVVVLVTVVVVGLILCCVEVDGAPKAGFLAS